jgi:photosystem II stability/assembly factor-like uncharacterized protein
MRWLPLVLALLAGPAGPREAVDAEERAEAQEALSFWADSRSYPAPEMPAVGYFQAFDKERRAARGRIALSAADPWVSLGPANRAGRTLSLAVDPGNPNVVYAGAASGGLWRMTINGNSYRWEYVDTHFPVLGVGAIAIDPRDAKVIYVGTGEVYGYGKSIGGIYIRNTRGSYGIGILKSTDGGVTWKKSLDWTLAQQRGVQALRLNPKNPDVVFAGTSEGLYRSRDAGATWEQVLNTLMAVDVAVNPANPDIVYVSCGNMGTPGAGVYRSTNGGAPGSFQKLAGGLPASWRGKTMLAISASAPSTIFADVADEGRSQGLYRSDNGGDSWTAVNTTTDWADIQGWYSHYVRVHPTNGARVLLGGVSFYASTDGGATLQTKSGMHPDHHCFADDPSNPDVVYFCNDGGVYQSRDGGNTFRSMNDGYVTAQFYNGFSSSPQNPSLAIGGLQDNGSVMYSGTTTWRSILGADGAYTAIHPTDPNILYASIYFLRISRSKDGGRTFMDISENLQGGSCFVSPFVLAPSQPSTLYGGKDILYKSTDGGDSWQAMNGGRALNGSPIVALGVAADDPAVVYAATVPSGGRRAQIFASTDGGQTVKDITGTLPDRFYLDLIVSPRDKRVVHVTLSGYGSAHLYRTEDGGGSWVDIGKGLPDVPTSALAIDPMNDRTLYVGNDIGVYVSQDQGQTWAEWKEGMPSAALVMDLSLSPANRKIRAVTHGNGVYERALASGPITGETPADAGVAMDAARRDGAAAGAAGDAPGGGSPLADASGGPGAEPGAGPTAHGDGGCACRVTGAPHGAPAGGSLAALLLVAALVRGKWGIHRGNARWYRRSCPGFVAES